MIDFHERIQDEKYQQLLGALIDEFYTKVKGAKLIEVVKSEANLDIIETLMRYASEHFEVKDAMILMLLLGVYLSSRDDAILPLDVN